MSTSWGRASDAVDLVDDDDGRQLGLQRLAEHVTRLRQRAFAGVDQQHDAVDHLEGAFDFAAEVAVSRGVDDVDLDAVRRKTDVFLARMVMPRSRSSSFESMMRSTWVFVGAKGAALLQHGVDQRRLAVVNVRDDGDIANAYTQIEWSLLGEFPGSDWEPSLLLYYAAATSAERSLGRSRQAEFEEERSNRAYRDG